MRLRILDHKGIPFGYVDSIRYFSDTIQMEGWAYSQSKKKAADFVLITAPNDLIISIVYPTLERPDVDEKNPLCGWKAVIPSSYEVYHLYACFQSEEAGYEFYSVQNTRARTMNTLEDAKRWRECRNILREIEENFTANSPFFRNPAETAVSITKEDIRLIAFYLPQFHPVPENNEWWGTGFTEWTNVTQSLPIYRGHYQPHLPSDLGYYDLRLPLIQEQQVALAEKYGISGFCFYYYWFDGRKILEKPLDSYINNPNINFPFCICWANENWTRRWDGLESEVLLEQQYSDDSYLRFIQDISGIIRHPGYIRVDDRPLIIVYRTLHIPAPRDMAEIWRKYCREEGIGEIFLVAAKTFGFSDDPRSIGFDAVVEFPPHGIVAREITPKPIITEYNGKIFSYPSILQNLKVKTHSYPYFYTAFPSWDNTPRRGFFAHVFDGSTPELYKEWLKKIIGFTMKHNDPGKKFVFINAWNEWAEGAHLEPDMRNGHAYLVATKEAIEELRDEA